MVSLGHIEWPWSSVDLQPLITELPTALAYTYSADLNNKYLI